MREKKRFKTKETAHSLIQMCTNVGVKRLKKYEQEYIHARKKKKEILCPVLHAIDC